MLEEQKELSLKEKDQKNEKKIKPRSQKNKKRKLVINENDEEEKEEAKDTVSEIATSPKIKISPITSGRFRKLNYDASNLDYISEVS